MSELHCAVGGDLRTLMVATLISAAGCGPSCEVDAPLDYSDSAQWLCHPDDPGECPDAWSVATVSESGDVTPSVVRAEDNPGLACFAIYPTLDLSLNTGLHTNLDRLANPRTWARTHGGALREVCDVYLPVYRQVRLGTYFGQASATKDQCFETAYADVLAAFESFLAAEPSRGIVLYGHSQGGQHISRLMKERIEPNPDLVGRLVASYPLGWPVGTAPGSSVGGSFASIPHCTSATQTGCVVGARTYLAGAASPDLGRFTEGEQAICVNPASPEDPSAVTRLAAFTMDAGHNMVDAPAGVSAGVQLRYEGAFEAHCDVTGLEGGLEVRWARTDTPPINLESGMVTANNGAHIIDLNLLDADVVLDVARRGQAWSE